MDAKQLGRFEQVALPHLDAAYALARWLVREEHDAEDAVQDAYLRAYQAFEGFRGDDGRPWLLMIVRNTCFTRLQQRKRHGDDAPFDDDCHGSASETFNPENILLARLDAQRVRDAIAALPLPLREVIVLREMESLAYKQIADVVGAPIGTVMSRLSRARAQLQQALSSDASGVTP